MVFIRRPDTPCARCKIADRVRDSYCQPCSNEIRRESNSRTGRQKTYGSGPCARCRINNRVNMSYCLLCVREMNKDSIERRISDPCITCGLSARAPRSQYCATCNRTKKTTNKLKRMGSSLEAFQVMIYLQDGLCSVDNCGNPAEVADHDKDTGEIRSPLCNNCNLALGLMYENPARIVGLADYARQCQNVKVFKPHGEDNE